MKISFTKDFRCFKSGQEIPIELNKVNYWVGPNGCGKSTALQCLLTEINKKQSGIVGRHLWNGQLVGSWAENVNIEGYRDFSGVSFHSDKIRQAQWCDMDVLLSMGLNRKNMSEGQNAVQDLAEAAKHSQEKDRICIFDEIDSHLDYKGKIVFFRGLLPKTRCTTIVISHDSHFLDNQMVLDFTDMKRKSGAEFYREQAENLEKALSSK